MFKHVRRVISLFSMKSLRVFVYFVTMLMLPGFAFAAWGGEPANTMEIDHVALQVSDLAKSVAFYEKIIGLQKLQEPFHDGVHAWMRLGPHVALHLISGATAVTEHPIAEHFCLHASSLDAFIASLDAAHIPYRNFKGDGKTNTRVDGVRQIYLQDPDGFWIEVNDAKYQ